MEILHPDIQKIKSNNQVIYEVYRGSFVYGTYIEGKSDKDTAGVHISPLNEVLGFEFSNQVTDEKGDALFYDIKRFLELAAVSNPSILELLFTPEKFQIYKHPIMNLILDNKEKFLTKLCEKTFLGYASQQIQKARGADKKMNWQKDKVERKTVLDFCYVPDNFGTIPLLTWLEERNLKQEYCGLVKMEHMKDVFSVFYDFSSHKEKEGKRLSKHWVKFPELHAPEFACSSDLKYRGVVHKTIPKKDIDNLDEPSYKGLSNDVSLSEVPRKEIHICHMNFNKDGYSSGCKKYNEYQEYTKNVNLSRLVDVQNHNQKIDGKNMLHCVRLIKTVKEIAEGKGLIIERPDAKELLDIRFGKVDLNTLIDWSENELASISGLFQHSSLPETVDPIFVNDLLIEMRKEFYGIK